MTSPSKPSSPAASRQFQAPRGTRDFYPADMAVRRHIENVWRDVSIAHGFDEIEGPTFEHLDLYTHKSGPGIVSELFSFKRAGGETDYALRPEFTPTLARMVAARAGELPRPIKWFAIPSHFRAERPQRGRLREFLQWNVDFIGDDSPRADAEVIATAVAALERLGLKPEHARVRFNHREFFARLLVNKGVDAEQIPNIFVLVDQLPRLAEPEVERRRVDLNIDHASLEVVHQILLLSDTSRGTVAALNELRSAGFDLTEFTALMQTFAAMGLGDWIDIDLEIVRGLAYYTGTVFEIHEATGAERAIAGGGRYDNLIESFGGPKLPACGFGMGDVVLSLVLQDKGLLKPGQEYLPRPDAFVFAANDDAAARLPAIVADLRKHNLHVRNSYKTTRNVGKLLGDAGKSRARYAVILGAELAAQPPRVTLKNLDSGEQPPPIPLVDLAARLRSVDAVHP